MIIKFTKQTGIYAPGTILDVGSGLALTYINRGVAQAVKQGDTAETASLSPGEGSQKPTRGRPKKVR